MTLESIGSGTQLCGTLQVRPTATGRRAHVSDRNHISVATLRPVDNRAGDAGGDTGGSRATCHLYRRGVLAASAETGLGPVPEQQLDACILPWRPVRQHLQTPAIIFFVSVIE